VQRFSALNELLLSLSTCRTIDDLLQQLLSRRARHLFDCEHMALFYRIPAHAVSSSAATGSASPTAAAAAASVAAAAAVSGEHADVLHQLPSQQQQHGNKKQQKLRASLAPLSRGASQQQEVTRHHPCQQLCVQMTGARDWILLPCRTSSSSSSSSSSGSGGIAELAMATCNAVSVPHAQASQFE
jgi:hypothetical protein